MIRFVVALSVALMVAGCATYSAYPSSAGSAEQEGVWVEHTSGYQCEDELVYASCDQAVAHLSEIGVQVSECRTTTYMVIAVCGAARSLFYQCRIPPEHVAAALELGWREVRAQ